MKKKHVESYRFTFPRDISFEEVPEYMERFDKTAQSHVIFDLTMTESLHSSFLGFMIHAHQSTQKRGGNLVLLLSDTAEKLLLMMNLLDYFCTAHEGQKKKKTA